MAEYSTSAICRTQPGDESAERFLIAHGAGGAGKTRVINKFARTLTRAIFGPAGEGAVAAPNSVARILSHGATKIHAVLAARRRRLLDMRSLSAGTLKGPLSQE